MFGLRHRREAKQVVQVSSLMLDVMSNKISTMEADNKMYKDQNAKLNMYAEGLEVANDAIIKQNADHENKIAELQLSVDCLMKLHDGANKEIYSLQAIITNLRKQKVYEGQKFYNPTAQSSPTVYLCARWNDWYMIRLSNQLTPQLMSAEQWKISYGHYVVLPRMNANQKNII